MKGEEINIHFLQIINVCKQKQKRGENEIKNKKESLRFEMSKQVMR